MKKYTVQFLYTEKLNGRKHSDVLSLEAYNESEALTKARKLVTFNKATELGQVVITGEILLHFSNYKEFITWLDEYIKAGGKANDRIYICMEGENEFNSPREVEESYNW
jgi:hypothetical protein